MRKQTKIAAITSAAALLAIGASMTSFANWGKDSEGWDVYYDSDGYLVTNEWKKWPDNGEWYYLGEDGHWMSNALIGEDEEDTYWVQGDGKMLKNDWQKFEDGPYTVGDNEVNVIYYYFDANGKAKKSAYVDWQGARYYFDESGHMYSGWNEIDGSWYYLGEETDGAGKTAWVTMEKRETAGTMDAEEVQYYFDKGIMQTGEVKSANGKWYYLDSEGVLKDGWFAATKPASAANAYFNAENGKATGDWVYAPDVKGGDGSYWYYVDNKGLPFNYDGKTGYQVSKWDADEKAFSDQTENVAIGKIKNKFYLFDSSGRMLSGIYKFDTAITCTKGSSKTFAKDGIYYFSGDDYYTGQGVDGCMMLNVKVPVTDQFGDKQNFYFSKEGAAYTNQIVNSNYYDASGLKAENLDEDTVVTLAVDTLEDAPKVNGKADTWDITNKEVTIIVTAAGRVLKNTTIELDDGYKYYIGKMPSYTEDNVYFISEEEGKATGKYSDYQVTAKVPVTD